MTFPGPVPESVAWSAFLIGIISACSLPLGAVTIRLWRPDDRTTAVLMAFGGGALLAALTIDLVGSALQSGHFNALAFGAVLGGILFAALNQVVNDFGGFLRKASTTVYHLRRREHQRIKRIAGQIGRTDLFGDLSPREYKALAPSVREQDVPRGATIYQAGDPADAMLILGMTLDGIPESVVLGASTSHSAVGISLIVGLFLANYPEALSSSAGMREQGMSVDRIVTMWSGLMLMTGAIAAAGRPDCWRRQRG